MSNSKKVHIALNVSDVNRSVAFYRAMFGADPVKRKPGYAKFSIDEPALNLTLNYEGEISEPGALNHLGVEVENSTQVLAAKKRLAEAGLSGSASCCSYTKALMIAAQPLVPRGRTCSGHPRLRQAHRQADRRRGWPG